MEDNPLRLAMHIDNIQLTLFALVRNPQPQHSVDHACFLGGNWLFTGTTYNGDDIVWVGTHSYIMHLNVFIFRLGIISYTTRGDITLGLGIQSYNIHWTVFG